ncbi:hypothetical protein ACFC0D_36780 [Streptomyces sp. NPDC056222]
MAVRAVRGGGLPTRDEAGHTYGQVERPTYAESLVAADAPREDGAR